jgi:hypothetical protein
MPTSAAHVRNPSLKDRRWAGSASKEQKWDESDDERSAEVEDGESEGKMEPCQLVPARIRSGLRKSGRGLRDRGGA